MPGPRDAIGQRLRRQAGWCADLGSPMYASLLESAAEDVEKGGPAAAVLDGFANEPGTAAVALRFMAAVHRLVLEDELPALAAHYPSTGGDGDAKAAWPLFRQALVDRQERIRTLVNQNCQTNEVGRSAALLGGFLEVAHRTGLDLRILELGASAGLNLWWDRYHYESPRGEWGNPNSRVHFKHAFEMPPPLHYPANVVVRKGCDSNPIDPTTDDGALTLRSFVWADQLGRLTLLDGAIQVANENPVLVERIGAADFIERELSWPRTGLATVVYHSVFMQYVDDASRVRIVDAIERARNSAARAAPVHHLAFEPGKDKFEVRLDGHLLATAGAHGNHVHWLVSSRAE